MPYHTNKPHDFNQRLIIFANAIKSVKELYETIIDLKIFRLMVMYNSTLEYISLNQPYKSEDDVCLLHRCININEQYVQVLS